ncbi:MAG: LPS export ABC transporter ATP-binding protein [Pseudomonadota bacterium]
MATLRARNLRKSYKKRQVVTDASLVVHSGEIVGLLGPNGAGKTTCFYMIAGLVKADAGEVSLDEHDITSLPVHQRARMGIGYLPQESSVFRRLSVADNIRSMLQLRRSLTTAQRESMLESLLDELQIQHIRESEGIALSGGERRRVEIARALAMEPRFILLDEPFAGVDPISVGEIQRIIRHLKDRGIGVLITDHNVRETLGICQRAYILGGGSVMAEGSPDDILDNVQVKEVYLGKDFQI